jgi:hypothetical protein
MSKRQAATPVSSTPLKKQKTEEQLTQPIIEYLKFTTRELSNDELNALAAKGWSQWMSGRKFAVLVSKSAKNPGEEYLFGGGRKFLTFLRNVTHFQNFLEKDQQDQREQRDIVIVQKALPEYELFKKKINFLMEVLGREEDFITYCEAVEKKDEEEEIEVEASLEEVKVD